MLGPPHTCCTHVSYVYAVHMARCWWPRDGCRAVGFAVSPFLPSPCPLATVCSLCQRPITACIQTVHCSLCIRHHGVGRRHTQRRTALANRRRSIAHGATAAHSIPNGYRHSIAAAMSAISLSPLPPLANVTSSVALRSPVRRLAICDYLNMFSNRVICMYSYTLYFIFINK